MNSQKSHGRHIDYSNVGQALLDGGSGTAACPEGTYDLYKDCLDEWSGATDDPEEKCDNICYGGSFNENIDLSPPDGAKCKYRLHFWGMKFDCNKKATDWIAYAATIIGSAATIVAVTELCVNVVVDAIAVLAGVLAFEAGTCTFLDKSLVIATLYSGRHVFWCD